MTGGAMSLWDMLWRQAILAGLRPATLYPSCERRIGILPYRD